MITSIAVEEMLSLESRGEAQQEDTERKSVQHQARLQQTMSLSWSIIYVSL